MKCSFRKSTNMTETRRQLTLKLMEIKQCSEAIEAFLFDFDDRPKLKS